MEYGGVLRRTPFFPVGKTERVAGPVAVVVAGNVVVAHIDCHDAITLLVENLLMLGQYFVLVVISIVVDIADASLLVSQRTLDEAITIVIGLFNSAKTFLFLHTGPKQIAIAVVDTVNEIEILYLTIAMKVHKLVLGNSILSDHLLNVTA